jgi:hypothetical protein
LLTNRPAPLSNHDLRSWYEARVAELIKRGETSSSEDDWQMAQRQFPDRVKRARVRAAREELAPAEWKKQGRRSPATTN